MELSLNALKSAKAFSAKPVKKTITWGEHTFDTYVRPISFQTAMGDIQSMHGTHFIACRIASSLCDADGKDIMTPYDITGEVVYDEKGEVTHGNPEQGAMDGELVKRLLVAISEVQNMGKTTS